MKTTKELSPQEAYERASNYCVRREHCTKDVQNKLYEWGIDRQQWTPILDKLIERELIDEGRYARAFARDKHLYSHWGKIRIRQELKARSIPSQLIDSALEDLFAEHDEDEQLKRTLESKLRSLKVSDSPQKRKEQLFRFASYRGYSYDSISRVLASITRDTQE